MKNYLAITLLLSTLQAVAMKRQDFPPQIKIEKKDRVQQIRKRFESFNLGAGAAQEEAPAIPEFDFKGFAAAALATTVESALEASGAFEDGAAIEPKEEEARTATPFAAAVEEAGDITTKPNSPLAQVIAEEHFDEEAQVATPTQVTTTIN